jgi:hypothetical protein
VQTVKKFYKSLKSSYLDWSPTYLPT